MEEGCLYLFYEDYDTSHQVWNTFKKELKIL